MKYALLIYDTKEAWENLSDVEQKEIFGEYMAVSGSPGIVGGEQLAPVETATTVRVRDGQRLVTDGPFADTKEFFGGYFVLDADDLDAALDLAARIPAARMGGAIEVRPIVEM